MGFEMPKYSRVRVLAIAGLIAFAACARLHSSSKPEPPSDANIAAILLAANNTDISYAELVPAHAQSPAVKDFAQRMLTDHNLVNKRVNELLAAISLSPEDDITSLDLRDESAAKRDTLRELNGRAFDSTYMANEVSYHTKLLAAIDGVLLPNARNPRLKQLIAGVRPAVAAHLEHAHTVSKSLK